jgi:hypothetical protein
MESQTSQRIVRACFLTGFCLVGSLVMLAGLGVAFGSNPLSLFGFFGALILLALLRLVAWRIDSDSRKGKGESPRG